MLSDRDKAIISTLARRYGAAKVWLFGSNADPRKRGRDLDLAVEGLAAGRFFNFVGELMMSLSRPVDVVALEKRSKLSDLIRREGIPINCNARKHQATQTTTDQSNGNTPEL